MNKVALVIKNSPQALEEGEKLSRWLMARGLEVTELSQVEYENGLSAGHETPAGPVPDVDLAVILGGDGTLLYAARTLGIHGIPLLGVNMGALGFMTEINLESLYPTVSQVLDGDYKAEERMMLEVEVVRGENVTARHTVLNDAVINKGALARILEIQVKVDGWDLTTYRSDGLIISTPTGSTAYNLSAGGPIVHPAHETIVLTPICPFTLTNRPLILPVNMTIEIAVDPHASDVILTSDGQVSCPLEPGDFLKVARSKSKIKLIKNPYKDYFEILRTKLGWG